MQFGCARNELLLSRTARIKGPSEVGISSPEIYRPDVTSSPGNGGVIPAASRRDMQQQQLAKGTTAPLNACAVHGALHDLVKTCLPSDRPTEGMNDRNRRPALTRTGCVRA